MKPKILIVALAIALTMTCNTAWAQGFVQFDDSSTGIPIVTTDLLGGSFATGPQGSATITYGNEEATVTGFLLLPTVAQAILPLGGQRSVILQEPFNTQPSDFVTLTVSDYTSGPNGIYQFVNVFFQSDGATNFATNVANLTNVVGFVTEDGSRFQDLINVLGSSPLDVYVRSGEEPASVPEPMSLFLFGVGLVGMAVIRGRNERRAT